MSCELLSKDKHIESSARERRTGRYKTNAVALWYPRRSLDVAAIFSYTCFHKEQAAENYATESTARSP
jgi:hypothetical protein